MGGKNHQPCDKFLPESTEISLRLSLLAANLNLANAAFERAFHVSLQNGAPSLDESICCTNEAIQNAQALQAAYDAILVKLQRLEFQPLPETSEVFSEIARDLAEQANIIFAPGTVQFVNNTIMSTGYRGLFTAYREMAVSIERSLRQVHADFTELNEDHLVRLVDACEQNWVGIRISFCRTNMQLNALDSAMVYSSLASAETWSRNQGWATMIVSSSQLETTTDEARFVETPVETVIA